MIFEVEDERNDYVRRTAKRYNEEIDSILSIDKNFNVKKYINYIDRILKSINEDLEKVKDNELTSFNNIFKVSDDNSINTINDIFEEVNFSDRCNELFKLILFEYYEWDIDSDDEPMNGFSHKELNKIKNEIFQLKIELFKDTLIYEAKLKKLKELILNIRKASKSNTGMQKYKEEFVAKHNLKNKIYSLENHIKFENDFYEKLYDYLEFGTYEFANRIPIYAFPVFCYALLNNIEELDKNKLGMYDFYNERKIALKAPDRRDKPDIYKDDYIKRMKIDLKRYCLIDKWINIIGVGEKKIVKTLSFFWFNNLTRYNDILELGKLGCKIIDNDISYESQVKVENKIASYANILSNGVFSNKLILENFQTKKLFESEKIGNTYRLLLDKLDKYISLYIENLSEKINLEDEIDKIINEFSNDNDLYDEKLDEIITQILNYIELIENPSDDIRTHFALFYAYKAVFKNN